jgi:ATP-dependent Lon protease
MIMRMLKMPDGRLKVLVQGLTRARILDFVQHDPFDLVRIETIDELVVENPGPEEEALLRSVKEQSEKILTLRGIDAGEIMNVLNSVNEHGRLADLVASNLRMKSSEAQRILESHDPIERLNLVNSQLVKEVEVASMQAKIQSMAKEGMDKAQREYFLREQLKAIRRELGDKGGEGEEMEELRKTLNSIGLPKKVKKEADKQLSRLESMHPDSSEATILRTYIDWLIELPWKKSSKDRLDIKEAARILHEDHYNLEKVKERILEYLSVRKLNPSMKGPILCFVGPPGVGKTSLGKSIARSLGRKFVRMSLGGMRDEAEIRGHRRTYIGAMPGRIIQSMKDAGTVNPVIMLDEIDKLGNDFRGDPSSALLEVLDPEQNNSFTDHYLNVPYDLSKVMFICTANMLDTIPSALLDRMEVIRRTARRRHEGKRSGGALFCAGAAEELGIDPTFFESHDIHVHVPAGAIPKDGPSAGVTMAVALISALSKRPVSKDVAMTGELTLRGKVLPVGGLKEKVLAAVRHHVSTVLLPQRNMKDLEDIPAHLRKKVKLVPVRTMDDVLSAALVDPT